MQSIEFRILKTIQQHRLLFQQDAVIVAVSGGPDSMALLWFLNKLMPDCSITAVYINHNLRLDEIAAEQACVEQFCQTLGVNYRYATINVRKHAKHTGGSLEECARVLRYKALDEMCQACKANTIAVGHTSDDQAEEILIRLIRGTGLKGLSGMRPKNGKVIRPLLEVTKQELIHHLEELQITYCIDSSNASRAFLRNKIRLDLLPLLEQEFNPAIRQKLCNTATILQDEEQFLETKTAECFEVIVSANKRSRKNQRLTEELSVTTDMFEKQHPAIRRRIIEKMCWHLGCRPTFKAINDVDQLAGHGRTGAELHLSRGLRVIKTSGKVVFIRIGHDKRKRQGAGDTFAEQIIIEADGTYPVSSLNRILQIKSSAHCPEESAPHDLVLTADHLCYPLVLRAHHPGEKMRPAGAPGRKKVSRILSSRKIPKYLRHCFPVLVFQEKIIAIPGLTASEDFKSKRQASHYLIVGWNELKKEQ